MYGNPQIRTKWLNFRPVWLQIWQMTSKQTKINQKALLLCPCKLCATFRQHGWIKVRVIIRKCSIQFKIANYFVLCHLIIWQMIFKNNRAVWPWDLTDDLEIDNFYSRVTLQFDVWPWKTIGHLFYATSSFMHHFVAIGEFKLELKSGNAQAGSNLTIFWAVWL